MRTQNKTFIHDKQIPKILRNSINCMMFFLNFLFHLILFCYSKLKKEKKEKKKYFVSICAIFKNESKSFKEWIEFHLLIGVEHFYLYNNNSTDNFNEILKPYIDKGIVDLINWNYPAPCQFSAYEDAYKRFKSETDWIAFIDLDEFICPYFETNIQKWINRYKVYPSVVIYWKQFGTSGLLVGDDSKLVIEQYTTCLNKFYDMGKCIFNTDFEIADFTKHHVYSAKVNFLGFRIVIPPINEFKKFILLKSNRIGLFRNKEDFSIQINHYWSKSYIECVKEKFLSRGDVNNHQRNANVFFWHENQNMDVDYKIWRFLIEMKIKMGKVKDQAIIDFTNSKN